MFFMWWKRRNNQSHYKWMLKISTERETSHDWVGNVIHWELCKKLKFDHSKKWYMHNSESVLQSETHKLLWDFEIQTYHQILARWPDFIIIKNKKKQKNKQTNKELAELWILQSRRTADWNWKTVKGKINTPALLPNKKKTVEHKSLDYTRCNWCSWYSYRRIGTRTGWLGNNDTCGDSPNYSIVVISQNTEKSAWHTWGDLSLKLQWETNGLHRCDKLKKS